MNHVTIYKDPERYVAFPSVARLADGDILVSFRAAGSFSVARTRGGGHIHLDAETSICAVRSTDNGQSWDPATKTAIYDGPLDCGAALTSLSDGVVVAGLYNLWQLAPRERRHEISQPIFFHNPDLNILGSPTGCAVRRSDDNGHTWRDELRWVRFEQSAGAVYDARTGVAELADGSLIWMVCDGDRSRSERVWLVRSWDRGDSWDDARLVAADPAGADRFHDAISFAEPHFLPLEGGRILAMLRTEPKDSPAEGYLYQTVSQDWGMTWRPFKRTPLWGHPPHLLRLQSGAVLCTYGYRRAPYGIRACLSYDDGDTWAHENEVVLRDDGMGIDLGYPYSIQLDDGTILTVYYFYEEDGIRHIAGTFWREDEGKAG